MDNTMIRVDKSLTASLKLLKEITGSSTYQDVLVELVDKELLKHRVLTSSGYLKVGAVVSTRMGVPLVITGITEDLVTFHDKTYMFNGSKACYELKLVAESMDDYDGHINAE